MSSRTVRSMHAGTPARRRRSVTMSNAESVIRSAGDFGRAAAVGPVCDRFVRLKSLVSVACVVFEAFCNHSASGPSHLSDSVRAPVGIRGQAGARGSMIPLAPASRATTNLGPASPLYALRHRRSGGEVARHLGIVEQHDSTAVHRGQSVTRAPWAPVMPTRPTRARPNMIAARTKAGFTPKVARSRVIPVGHSSEATFLNCVAQ